MNANFDIKFVKSKVEYLNREKLLYDYILDNKNEDGFVVCNDSDLAKYFDVNQITVLRWRNRLKELGLINCSVKYVGGKKSIILGII